MSYNQFTQFAKGCFLADTIITTPNGDAKIQDLEPGDAILSFNEKTGEKEPAIINEIDILGAREYFTVKYTDGWGYGNELNVTAEHPFYVVKGKKKDGNMYLKKVKELEIGDVIFINGRAELGEITHIRKNKQEALTETESNS